MMSSNVHNSRREAVRLAAIESSRRRVADMIGARHPNPDPYRPLADHQNARRRAFIR